MKKKNHPDNYAASNLQELREAAGLSRKEFLDLLLKSSGTSMHMTTLKRIEDGEQPMKIDELLVFSQFFDVSLDQLVSLPIDLETRKIKMLKNQTESARFDLGIFADMYLFKLGEIERTLNHPESPSARQSSTIRDLEAILERDQEIIPLIEQICSHLDESKQKGNGER